MRAVTVYNWRPFFVLQKPMRMHCMPWRFWCKDETAIGSAAGWHQAQRAQLSWPPLRLQLRKRLSPILRLLLLLHCALQPRSCCWLWPGWTLMLCGCSCSGWQARCADDGCHCGAVLRWCTLHSWCHVCGAHLK